MAKDMLTFDAGDLSDDQLMTVMAVANIAKARMDAVEKGCKAVLVGRMETGHQPAMLDGEELADITALLHTCLLETYGEDIPVEYLADAFWHTYRLRGLFPSKHGLRRVFFWLVEPLFGGRGFITGHVSPRQLDKHLPDDWTDPFTGEHHDGGLFALLPKAVFRSEQFMGAALLYWMNRLPPAEFAEKLGSMSYLQGIATPESDPDTTNQTEKENTV